MQILKYFPNRTNITYSGLIETENSDNGQLSGRLSSHEYTAIH